MASLTAADLASRTMKKNWVQMTEADEAEEARDAAAMVTGRGAKNERVMNAPMKRKESQAEGAFQFATKRRKSPLYEKPTDSEED